MKQTCGCLSTDVDIASVLFSQNALPFDLLLETDTKLADQMQKMLSCQKCCGDSQVAHTILRIVTRLLDFDEAAISAYAIDGWERAPLPWANVLDNCPLASLHLRAPPSRPHQAKGPVQLANTTAFDQPWCLPSQVILGELSLDPTESRMLVEQLLEDSLLRLRGILINLKAVGNEMMGPDDRHAAERLIDQTMNGIAKLTGQLRRR